MVVAASVGVRINVVPVFEVTSDVGLEPEIVPVVVVPELVQFLLSQIVLDTDVVVTELVTDVVPEVVVDPDVEVPELVPDVVPEFVVDPDVEVPELVPDVVPEMLDVLVEPLVFVVDCGLVALVTVQK